MNKEYYKRLVDLYRRKDKLNKEIRSCDWDDAFTQQPEHIANEQIKLVSALTELNALIEYANGLQQ